MAYKVYKVERQIHSTGFWYEVMLSPFLRVMDAGNYISKYEKFYPEEERKYRVLDHKVDGVEYRRIKLFFGRMSNLHRHKFAHAATNKRFKLGV